MASPTDQAYVFAIDTVTRAIANVMVNPPHEHFAAYLAVLRGIRKRSGQPAKMSDINEFHVRYLFVGDAPERSPYLRPFRSRGKGLELFNANVAGSYAPSSLRSQGKLTNVLDVQGTRKSATYNLQSDHATAALDQLLQGHKVPAISLAAFLYRDYGFELARPEVARVLALFRDEFGLRASVPDEKLAFSTLFEDDSPRFQNSALQLKGVSGG